MNPYSHRQTQLKAKVTKSKMKVKPSKVHKPRKNMNAPKRRY